jgi:hypothetical protein
MNCHHIRTLVAQQLATIRDPARREALTSLLVEPRAEEREWDYGAPEQQYPYWVVAEAQSRAVILVYCEHGFGPQSPWGFLFTDKPEFATLGMDSQWDRSLEGAFNRSGLWSGLKGEIDREAEQRRPEASFPGGVPAAEQGAGGDGRPGAVPE